MHPTRAADRDLILSLARRGAWNQAYARSVLWDFAQEARVGFQLAFLRPFAVPRMAELLVRSGHITADPVLRSYRTGILIHELIVDGLDGPRSRQAVGAINRAHRIPGILQEDLTYVLEAFIVVPTRHLERTGWRPVLDEEREAAVRFYGRLGQMMAINQIPATYAEAEEHFEAYQTAHVAPSSDGVQLGQSVLAVLRDRLPKALRPSASTIFGTLLDDPPVLAALGLPPGATIARQTVRSALASLAIARRFTPAPTEPSFTPGQPSGPSFPDGYDLDDLTHSPRASEPRRHHD